MSELAKKYPKWAHRKDWQRKKRARAVYRSMRRHLRRKRKRRRAPKRPQPSAVTNVLLMQLLAEIQGTGPIVQPSLKHGSNVVSGYASKVTPDRLAPVRSQDERRRILQRGRTLVV